MTEMSLLQERIGYRFTVERYLITALTHASYLNENRQRDPLAESNERLEFLGDAVIEEIISTYLFETFPESAEGYLTEMRQHLVCESTLAHIASEIALGDFLRVGQGEIDHRHRPALLSDALEALIAAVYLDSGKNSTRTREVTLKLFAREIAACHRERGGDYKTRLLQLVQGDGNDLLSYEVERETGPAHDRVFEVVACLNSNVIGRGRGKTKKEAEQNAAKEALVLFGMIQAD